MKITSILIIGIAVLAIVGYNSLYTIDETEQVVITQFGRIVGEAKKEPGLRVKLPFIQKVNVFKKNLLDWDGEKGQIPTEEKTFIWVDSFARWRIEDPIRFFQRVNNEINALGKLNDIIDPAVRNAISSHDLIEAVRKSNRAMEVSDPDLENPGLEKRAYYIVEVGREQITKQILEAAQPKLKEFGITLEDVKIKRINYVDKVRDSVYQRMIAERNQIAEKFRSEGKGEAAKILGDKELELKKIRSAAYRKAQEIKGKADAEATALYAAAYGKDPEFYSFIQSLEIYNKSLDKNNSLIMSTDSDLLQYLKGFEQE